jgi:hypothetical protein
MLSVRNFAVDVSFDGRFPSFYIPVQAKFDPYLVQD